MKIDGMDVDVLILDLFGVVTSFDNDIVYARLARHCADPSAALEQLNGLMSARNVITGKTTLPKIHERLVDQFGLTLSFANFRAAWLEPYSQPMPGMADIIRALSKKCRLVLLSNVDQYYWQVVQAMHPELEVFELFLLSWNLGMAKPDRAIFVHACRTIGALPANCLFVDDTLVNIEAASEVGLQSHWFRSVQGFVDALDKGGFEVPVSRRRSPVCALTSDKLGRRVLV